MTCYVWRVEVPPAVQDIANDKSDQLSRMMIGKQPKQVTSKCCVKSPKHDPPQNVAEYDATADDHPLRIGFRFLADMINRLCFILISIALVVTCCATLLHVGVGFDLSLIHI